eukprot:3752182-Amphidinium_carterae.1
MQSLFETPDLFAAITDTPFLHLLSLLLGGLSVPPQQCSQRRLNLITEKQNCHLGTCAPDTLMNRFQENRELPKRLQPTMVNHCRTGHPTDAKCAIVLPNVHCLLLRKLVSQSLLRLDNLQRYAMKVG